jgi:hypothetical protein
LNSQYAEIVDQKNEILLNSLRISQWPIDRMNREVASRSKNKTNSPPCLEDSLGDSLFSTQSHYYQPTFSNGVNFCTISQSDYLTLPSDVSMIVESSLRNLVMSVLSLTIKKKTKTMCMHTRMESLWIQILFRLKHLI